MLDLSPNRLRTPIIYQLRAAHPGAWTFDAKEYVWKHESGRVVRPTAAFISEGVYETTWRWTDTGELAIPFTRQWRE